MSKTVGGLNIKILALIVVIVLVGGIGGYYFFTMNQGTQPQEKGITLTIITRHDTTIQRTFEEAFLKTNLAKQYNITDIKWLSPVPGLWDEVIDQGGIDIAWGGGPTLFDLLLEDNYLLPLNSSLVISEMENINDTIAGAPMKRFNDQHQVMWVAAAISSFGFTINKHFLSTNGLPEPDTWDDLASPTFGKLLPTPSVAMGNAPATTSNTRIYEIILEGFGWEDGWSILVRMGGNAKIYQGSVETQSAAETGEVGVSMSIDFYGYTTQLKNPDCKYVLPKGQTIVNGDPIALVKTTEHSEAAQAFIAWVLSVDGQALWLNENINRMPVRGDVFTKTDAGKNRQDLYAIFNETIHNIGIPFNDSRVLSYEEAMRYYFEAIITNAHENLVNAWKAIVDAYLSGKIDNATYNQLVQELTAPISWTEDGTTYTFTIEYAQSINNRVKTDTAFTQQMQSIWTQAAIQQYDAVLDHVNQLTGGS